MDLEHQSSGMVPMVVMPAGLPTLHNGPANELHVGLKSSVRMEEATTAVSSLSFPWRQAWRKSPALELDLSSITKAGVQPLHALISWTDAPPLFQGAAMPFWLLTSGNGAMASWVCLLICCQAGHLGGVL